MPPRRTPRTPPVTVDAALRVKVAALLAGDDDLELPNPLDTLALDHQVIQTLLGRQERLARLALAMGASYTDLGDALGINRVTAHNRFAPKDSSSC